MHKLVHDWFLYVPTTQYLSYTQKHSPGLQIDVTNLLVLLRILLLEQETAPASIGGALCSLGNNSEYSGSMATHTKINNYYDIKIKSLRL